MVYSTVPSSPLAFCSPSKHWLGGKQQDTELELISNINPHEAEMLYIAPVRNCVAHLATLLLNLATFQTTLATLSSKST